MSLALATRGYVGASKLSPQFVGDLQPDLATQDLAPEIFETHTQGNPTNPGAPDTVVETIPDLKPIILKKPRS